jgi:hypothetical protein
MANERLDYIFSQHEMKRGAVVVPPAVA